MKKASKLGLSSVLPLLLWLLLFFLSACGKNTEAGNKLPGELLRSTGADSYWVCETADGMYGIYDETALALVNDMRYEQIMNFDEMGMAWAYSNGYWGCIDQHGVVLMPFQFSDARDFQGEYAIVCMNQYGVIDRSGNFVIQPMYDEIKLYENVVQVKMGQKYGLVNYRGEVMAVPENDQEFQFIGSYLYSGVQKDRYGFTWGELFDQSGQNLMDTLPISDINEVSYAGEGMLRARRDSPSVPNNYYYGVKEIYLLDENLNLVSEQSFLHVSDFSSSGYAAACTFESYSRNLYGIHINDGGWTAIDKQGNWVVNLKPLRGEFSYNHYGAHYTYVSDDFAVADNWNGTYSLLNIHSDEMTQWDYIWAFPGTQCICAKSSETGLYTLYDGYELVDNQCTDIQMQHYENGDLYGFSLYHGTTETVYPLQND